ncbi:MAG TPA: hypothetical protein VEF36_15830, partial [Roseiarcus sp.]|nr:hypothetical protein [Roseiarcus sp.]
MHLESNIEIATPFAAKAGQAFAANAQQRIRLGAGGNLERDLSVDRRHVDAGAERRIDDIDRFHSVEIGALPFEARIVGRVNDDEEVACGKSRLFRGQTAAW